MRSLANGDGATLRIIDSDWGISADREKTHKRLAFLELMASVERGEVSTIYAFALDRLARSVQWSARLLDACEDAGTIVVTGEGRFDPANDRDRSMFHFFAMQNEGTLRAMKTKAKASADSRKRRGDAIGQRPYGEVRTRRDGVVVGENDDVALIVATFREAGSYFAAARLLNDRKVPSQSGRQWYPRTVQRIVNRADPTTARRGRPGARSSAGMHMLSGLLRCHCETMLGRTVSGEGTPRYRCSTGASIPTHSRPYMVSERKLLPWVIAEATRFDPRREGTEIARDLDGDATERARLADERAYIVDIAIAARMDRSELERRLAEIDAKVEAIDDRAAAVDVIPAEIDWDWEPEAINNVLRTYWSAVELGPDMRPVRAEWRLPPDWLDND